MVRETEGVRRSWPSGGTGFYPEWDREEAGRGGLIYIVQESQQTTERQGWDQGAQDVCFILDDEGKGIRMGISV